MFLDLESSSAPVLSCTIVISFLDSNQLVTYELEKMLKACLCPMHNCGTFAFRDVLAEVYRGWLFFAQVPTDNSFKHFQDWEIQFVAYSDECVVCSVSSLGWFSSLQPTRQSYKYLSGRLQEAVHSISPPETSCNSLSLCQQQSATPRFGPVFDMLFMGFDGTVWYSRY